MKEEGLSLSFTLSARGEGERRWSSRRWASSSERIGRRAAGGQ